jgi:hypothetical protein
MSSGSPAAGFIDAPEVSEAPASTPFVESAVTVEIMSEQTGEALGRAEAALAAEQAKTDRLEVEVLDRIAAGVPTAVDGIAKRVAESQPEITRQLGSDGVRAMRADLAEAAIHLAAEIRTAEISWPVDQSVRYGEVAVRHLDGALFGYLHGPRMDALVEVLQSHGFAIRGDGEQGAQDLVNPHDLYDEGWLTPLAGARTTLAAIESSVRAAKQSEVDAAVRSIWDGSEK